jgi:hypothetical protein
MYMEGQVWKVDANSGQVVGKAEVANADNSAWGSDGRLWVATHNGGISQMMVCIEDPQAPCSASFEIVGLDADTLEARPLFSHSGPPMGVATIAVQQAGRVYMGSFVGDRMISVPESEFGVE